MKIGIITNHADRTLESDLQTWAIHKTLDAYGSAPYVIHYHPWDGQVNKEKKGLFHKKTVTTQKITQPSSFINTHVNLLGNAETLEELYQEDFRLDAYISILDREYNPKGEENNAYLLNFIKGEETKIAYGWDLHGERAKGDFSQFESLSVQKGAEHTFSKEVPVVNDPLIWIKRKDIEKIKDRIPKEQPFVFVDVEKWDDSVMAFSKKVAKKQQLALKNIKENRNDVTYYLAVASQATKIVTDSMIGVLVAVLYEKPFVYLNTGNHKNRIMNFLTEMGILYHVEDQWDQEPQEERFAIREKKGALNRKMIALRRQSLSDLEETLQITKNGQKVECPVNITRGDCYGCFACEAVCPEHAIEMQMDKEGFVYPKVEERLCTGCGKCNEVCIRRKDNNVTEDSYPLIYGAVNKDLAVRMKSTSGGVFPALCKEMIEKQNGVVLGSRYDRTMHVVTEIADTMEEAEKFYGVKYAKTDLKGIFIQVKRMLKDGKKVLYSGLPCECAGLRAYLKKDYDNLIIQEVLCHSAPSPKVFEKYMAYLSKKFGSPVVNFVCRDKRNGWDMEQYQVCIQFENGQEMCVNGRKNNYMRAYHNSYLDRPSCSRCQFMKGYRAGDITVGDFLGAEEVFPSLYEDQKGVSLVLINTEKGKKFFENVKEQFTLKETTMAVAFRKNHKKPAEYRNERTELLNRIDEQGIDALLLSYNDLRK